MTRQPAPRRSRRFTVLAGLVTAALVVSACGSDDDAADDEPAEAPADEPATDDSAAEPADEAADGDGYNVAMSVAFVGNAWRKSMVQGWENAAENAKQAGLISDYQVSVSPQPTATSQISQIQSLILQKPDAINIDAESPTALNPVIKQACEAGIKVIVFDQTTDSEDDCAHFLYNPLEDYGAEIARQVAEQIGGAGNVILVEGVAGGKPNALILEGVEEVLAEYPDIEIVAQVVGESADSVTEQALTGVLPTLDEVDGVISWGGTSGIISAFTKAERPIPALVFDNSGESLRTLAELKAEDETFAGTGVFTDPGQGAAALQATLLLLGGEELPKEIITPVIAVPQADLDSWIDVTPPGAVAQWLWTEDDIRQTIDSQGSDDPYTPPIPADAL